MSQNLLILHHILICCPWKFASVPELTRINVPTVYDQSLKYKFRTPEVRFHSENRKHPRIAVNICNMMADLLLFLVNIRIMVPDLLFFLVNIYIMLADLLFFLVKTRRLYQSDSKPSHLILRFHILC